MGNKCGCGSGDIQSEISFNIGDDTNGVTHDFQYHDNYVKENVIKLDEFGKFYRGCACPMNLMTIKYFLTQLDGIRTNVMTGTVNHLVNYIPFQDFMKFFKNDPNWVISVQSPESPFLKMLEMDGYFVKTHEQIEAENKSYNAE